MIAVHRIKAFLLRHMYELWKSIDRKADIVFFPTIDLLVFGLLTVYIDKIDANLGLAGVILGGVIFWNLLYNIVRDIAFSLLDDAWSRNLYNFFSTPLNLQELIIGMLILSAFKALIMTAVVVLLGWGIFGFNLFGSAIVMVYLFGLFIFAWGFGFFTTSIILRFGLRAQALAWSLILLIYPVSGVYYPISVLPPLFSFIAGFLPASRVFTGLRHVILGQDFAHAQNLLIILLLDLVYLALGLYAFVRGFKSAKARGWFIHPS